MTGSLATALAAFLRRLRRTKSARPDEALLADAIESAEQGFAVYGADGRLAAFNKHYRAIVPSQVRFAVGDHFDEITRRVVASGARLTGPLREGTFPVLQQFLAAPIEQQFGDGRWLRVAARTTRAGGIVVTVNDVTERKRREHQIADSAAQMAAIVENMPLGVALYDAQSCLLLCNDRFRAMIRMPRELTLPGAPLKRLLDFAAERGDLEGAVEPLIEKIATEPATVEIITPGGMTIEFHGRMMPGGGAVITLSDISEHKRVQEMEHKAMQALAEAARVKSDFLANMSHELRTPLNAIIGFSEMMAAQILGPLPDRYREYAVDITSSARHLLALISDVLDLSKVESGHMELAEEIVDLAETAAAAITMTGPRATKGQIALSTDFPPDLPHLKGDRRRILQVFINLLTNSVKFTRAGGQITVAARLVADGLAVGGQAVGGLVVTIADTGIGIGPDDIPRVMQDWGQARSDTSRSEEGTGLGLPLSRRLMELHGGTLSLESQVGVGTTVSLWFPSQRVHPPAEPLV